MSFEQDFENAISRYNERLRNYGISQEALGWGKKGRANLRFEILLSQWNFNNKSILDFGCGFGDLINYIDSKQITNYEYTGVDINSQLIQIAKQKHPKFDFICADILKTGIKSKYDYAVSSGVFNYKMSDNFLFIRKVLALFADICNDGFAVNFLSDKVQFKEESLYYANPSQILELAYQFSNNIIIRNDYMPYEFTLFVNMSSKVNSSYTVYEEYLKFV